MPDTEKKKRKPLTPEQRAAQLKRNHAWDAANTTQVKFILMNKGDADIIEWLKLFDNRTGYLKSLIRADIAAHADDDTPDDISYTGTFENGVHTLRRKNN